MKQKLSDIIKLELMKYFRFERQYDLICTEGIHLADFNAYNGTTLVEVEVKISKSDFKKEFQKEINLKNRWKIYKHRNYSEPKQHLLNGYIVPNRFYFCVPAKLADWAVDYLKDKNSKYGLLSYDEERYTGNAHIITIKPARSLHTEEQDKMRIALSMARRTSNELITSKQNHDKDCQELDALRKGVIVAEGIEIEEK